MKKALLLSLLAAALATAAVWVLWSLLGPWSLVFAVFAALTFAFISLRHRLTRIENTVTEMNGVLLPLSRQAEDDYRQLESMFWLQKLLPAKLPLPPLRGWAISPEMANILICELQRTNPRCVLELGSGVSSLILGYCLQQQGEGRCLSLEQDERFAEQTNNGLEMHGLAPQVKIEYAELIHVDIAGADWQFYDLSALESLPPVELLLVDGPRNPEDDLGRYPALPLLWERLAPGATIIMDDCNRVGEIDTIKRWEAEFGLQRLSEHPGDKGVLVMRKR